MKAVRTAKGDDVLDLGKSDGCDGMVDVFVVFGKLEVELDGTCKVILVQEGEGLSTGVYIGGAGCWMEGGGGADAGWSLGGHGLLYGMARYLVA